MRVSGEKLLEANWWGRACLKPLLWARNGPCRAFMAVVSVNLPNSPVRWVLVHPFHWWGNWGSDQWSDLSKLHRESGRAGVGTPVHLTPQLSPLHRATFDNEKPPIPRQCFLKLCIPSSTAMASSWALLDMQVGPGAILQRECHGLQGSFPTQC